MNLDMAQETAQSEKQADRIYKKDELAEKAIPFCVQGAEKKKGQFGYQWEVLIFHAGGQQKTWFSGCDSTDKNAKPTIWDKVFSSVTDWPAHNYKLIQEKGKFYKFVHIDAGDCPCQDVEIDEILEETMGEDAPAGKEKMHAFFVMAKALKISTDGIVDMTLAEWKRAMGQLAMKQAGLA